jgi:uncharacterized delta-60 repeat protein
MVNVGICGYFDIAQEVDVQKDGKIIVAGYGMESASSFKGLSIARYLSDGSIDYDFGNLGLIQKQTNTLEGELNSIVIQKDDKIVAVGYSISSATNNENLTLVRFTINGKLDKSFGESGLIVTEISNQKEIGESVAIQPDGKIVCVGTTQHDPNFDIFLVRYDEYGQIDPYFGLGGIVITNINSGHDIGKSLAIQNDGKLIVAGFTYSEDNFYMTLLRYDSNGKLDSTFAKGGIAITDIKSSIGKLDLAMQNDGKIILVGPSEVDNTHHFTVVRFNNNGSPDNSFGKNGITKTIIGDFSEAESVAIDSFGNIVVAGTTGLENESFVVAMYNQNGILDPGFGLNGIVKINFNNSRVDRAHSLIIENDGKIIVAGETTHEYTTFGLVRLIGK